MDDIFSFREMLRFIRFIVMVSVGVGIALSVALGIVYLVLTVWLGIPV